eukprot:8999241-Prorocentrum_lima.AAC.1
MDARPWPMPVPPPGQHQELRRNRPAPWPRWPPGSTLRAPPRDLHQCVSIIHDETQRLLMHGMPPDYTWSRFLWP